MLEGMYTAAAGMAAQQTRLDAVSSDLANVDTTGYKHARVAFKDLVYDDGSGQGAAKGVQIGSGSAATVIGRSMQPGDMQNTGQPLDVGITGSGYIQVKLSDGRTALSRDGDLQADSQGRLQLHTGELLDPPVKLPPGIDPAKVMIGTDGTVTAGNVKAGQITLVDVPAPGALQGGPNNTFIAGKSSGGTRPAGNGTIVQQGFLEGSNVDASTAMTDMIEAQRAFQLAGKAITTQDQILSIANQVKK
jgi:flagellar basal-body rod protein FlgG